MKYICLSILLLLSGCSIATHGVQYSTVRGVGDVGTTIYLDNTPSWILQKPMINDFVNETLAWLEVNGENVTDNDFLKEELKKIVPVDFHFLVDMVVDRFGPVPIHNVRLSKHFFTGVKNGVLYYDRYMEDPVFQGKAPMRHAM